MKNLKDLNGFVFNFLILVLFTLAAVFSVSTAVLLACLVSFHPWLSLLGLVAAVVALSFILSALTVPKGPVY